MRADAKVYVLQDSEGTVISVNPSLKNLLEKMGETKKFSRSCPDRRATMATLKQGKRSIHSLKLGGEPFSIVARDLGMLADSVIGK